MVEHFVEIEGLQELLDRFSDFEHSGILKKSFFAEIGEYVVTAIKQRTAQGIDADGAPFKPYSPKYRLFREETGHQGSPVNLLYSGGMLGAMTYKASENDATIFFMNTTTKAPKGKKATATNPEKAFYNQKSRNFFAISSQERERILEIAQDFIHRRLAGNE